MADSPELLEMLPFLIESPVTVIPTVGFIESFMAYVLLLELDNPKATQAAKRTDLLRLGRDHGFFRIGLAVEGLFNSR